MNQETCTIMKIKTTKICGYLKYCSSRIIHYTKIFVADLNQRKQKP